MSDSRARSGIVIALVALALIGGAIALFADREAPEVAVEVAAPAMSERGVESPALPTVARDDREALPTRAEATVESGTAHVTVRVVDDDEVPVAGIVVRATWNEPFETPNPPHATEDVRCDSSGEAKLDLAAGSWLLNANPLALTVDTRFGGDEKEIALAAGQARAMLLVLHSMTARLVVTVIDDFGRPISEQDVSVQGREVSIKTTDTTGIATFDGLEATRSVRVALEGALDDTSPYVIERPWQSVALAPHGETRVQFQLESRGSIHLTFEPRPAAGETCSIMIVPNKRVFSSTQSIMAERVDAASDTLDWPVPRGEYDVRIRFPATSEFWACDQQSIAVAAATKSIAQFRLAKSGITLHGIVRDEQGLTVAGVRAWAYVPGAVGEIKDAASGADGRFEIHGVPTGSIRVGIDTQKVRDRNLAFFGSADRAYVDVVTPAPEFEVRVESGFALNVQVRSRSGREVGAERVTIDHERTSTTDSERSTLITWKDGSRVPGVMFAHLRAGSYRVWLGDGKQQPGAPSAGVVLSRAATPDGNAWVELMSE